MLFLLQYESKKEIQRISSKLLILYLDLDRNGIYNKTNSISQSTSITNTNL